VNPFSEDLTNKDSSMFKVKKERAGGKATILSKRQAEYSIKEE